MAEPSVQRLTGTPIILSFPEESTTQTFIQGDLVTLTTSGTVTIAQAGKILGVAQQNSTGSATHYVDVDLIDYHNLYSAPLPSGTTAAQTIVGDELTFIFTATAVTLSTTGTDAVVMAMDPRSLSGGSGVAGGRMIFRFEANLSDTPT
jgi:hypothetical protein